MNNELSIANKFEHSNNPLIDAAKPVFIMANSMQSTTSQLLTPAVNSVQLNLGDFSYAA